MNSSSASPLVIGLVLLVGWAATSCGPIGGGPGHGGGGNGDNDGGPDDPRSLESCQFGTVSVTSESTTQMEDHFSGLPNKWGVAEYAPLADLATVKFGLSESEVFTGETVTSLQVALTIQVGEGSGDFTSDAETGVAYAQLVGGEYVGKGKGGWAAGTQAEESGTISGNWSIDESTVGGRISGSVTVNLASTCAPADSSTVYQFDFDLELTDPEDDHVADCDFGSGYQLAALPGTVEVEVDGESLPSSESGVAAYQPDDDQLTVGAGGDDSALRVGVEAPSFGENEVTSAVFSRGECTYRSGSSGNSTVTVEQNESGSLDHGPTSGSMDLELAPVDGSPSSCKSDPVQVSGTFGLGVCKPGTL